MGGEGKAMTGAFVLHDGDKRKIVFDWKECKNKDGNYVRPNKEYCCAACKAKPDKHKPPHKVKHFHLTSGS